MTKQITDDELEVVRVEIEGITASFRYPHFLIGRQPTYPVPPLSTVFGLVSAALGKFPLEEDLHVAYTFSCEHERTDDLEKIWFVEPNTSPSKASKPHNLNAKSNVLPRELLVNPKMTLYVAAPRLEALYDAFRMPYFPLVLGRSQDLVSVLSVDRVVLSKKMTGVIEPGLLPLNCKEFIPYGISLNMPRYINPNNRQEIIWDWFLALDQPFKLSENLNKSSFDLWSDDSRRHPKLKQQRLLMFHSLTTNE